MTNLFMDIETIPDQTPGALSQILADIKPPANYKKPETIEKWMHENGEIAAAEQFHKTGLNGLSGEICSIAWAIGDIGDTNGHVRLPGESESDLLEAFFEDVQRQARDGEGAHQFLTWIGHNIIEFDLRFIKQRCIVNSVRPPFIIPADAKHGGNSVFDTMKAWAGWKGYVSQDALFKALMGPHGITLEQGMDGSEVWQKYQDGKFEEILEYNKSDVSIVQAIYRRMSWA